MSDSELEIIGQELREQVKKVVDEGKILGISLALLSKDDIILMESFGYTDASKSQIVDENTLFSLQSTTKTVTAVGFFLAEQAGLVQLDNPIINYYPEFLVKSLHGDDEYKKITFKHLLNHKSGLGREAIVGGCFSRKIPTWEEHIKSINGTWLQSPVGTKFSYSNAGMNLVTYLLERITRKPYSEYIQEVLGDPLGITHHWDIKEIYSQPNAAKGYLGEFEAHKLDGVAYGCGGAFISIKDQAAFVQFLLNKGTHNGKKILDPKYIDLLRTTYDGNGGYGFGTEVLTKYGIHMTKHVGGGFGLGSEMIWLPDYNIGLAHINNNEYYSYYQLSSAIFDCIEKILDAKGVDTKSTDFPHANDPEVTVNPEKLKRLEGIYKSDLLTFEIEELKGKLYYVVGSNKEELLPHSETAFTTKSPYGMIFDLDEKGRPIGSKLYHSGEGLLIGYYSEKTETKKLLPANKDWKKYVGLYYSMYYYTEYNFTSVSLDDEGYLQLGTSRLEPTDSESNVFQSKNGKIVIFDTDSFIHDNIKYTRLDDAVHFYKNLVENEPEHRAFVDYMIDGAITGLKQLNQKEEAKVLEEIKKK